LYRRGYDSQVCTDDKAADKSVKVLKRSQGKDLRQIEGLTLDSQNQGSGPREDQDTEGATNRRIAVPDPFDRSKRITGRLTASHRELSRNRGPINQRRRARLLDRHLEVRSTSRLTDYAGGCASGNHRALECIAHK
jgi:hypothetical protein